MKNYLEEPAAMHGRELFLRGTRYLLINVEEDDQNKCCVISCGDTPLAHANEALIFLRS